MTYRELDARANQLARFLVRRGVRPGDRIGLLFDAAVDSYVAMLAVLKAHAAYVPLDAAFPADRLAFITADAGLRLVLTHSRLARPAEPLAPRPGCCRWTRCGTRWRPSPRAGWAPVRSRPRPMTCVT